MPEIAGYYGQRLVETFRIVDRERLVRQMLTESFLLASLGGGLGILVGWLGIEGLRHLISMGMLQGAVIGIDRNVLLFSGAMIILVAIAFGLVPAWQASQPRVSNRTFPWAASPGVCLGSSGPAIADCQM